jgi:hypothetical protein
MIPSLPPLRQTPSPNYSSRNGARVRLVVVHDCEGSGPGAVSWFAQRRSEVSAHIVLNDDGGFATQCVPLNEKAWHACGANPISDSIELGGYAKLGFGRAERDSAAAIVAWLLHRRGLSCRWAEHGEGDGFCSHYDLGAFGGGHFDITTDRATWLAFAARVQAAYAIFAKGPLPDWALHGLPAPVTILPPPPPPLRWAPSSGPRKDAGAVASHPSGAAFPTGSLGDIQWRLNVAGANPQIDVDGLYGKQTRDAIAQFQSAHGLFVDGEVGGATWPALEAASP